MHLSTRSLSTAQVCTEMPSATSARDFMAGVHGSSVRLLLSYLGRTLVVAGGMYAAGKRSHIIRDAAAGTAILETLLLAYFSSERNRTTAIIPTQQHISQFLSGNARYAGPIAVDILVRTAELALGSYLAGSRKGILIPALGGSLAVEALIVLYVITQGRSCAVP